MNVESFDYTPVVRINAPDWYQREDWMAWLNSEPQPATWHSRGSAAGDYSDVFFTFCDGEGSDAPSPVAPKLPHDIWEQITELLEAQGIRECLIWVTNLQDA